jgi:uncharacterized protein (UPF0335 family)
LRDRLPEMADVNAYWAALAPEWERIRSLPETERTEAIRKIVKPIQARDPGHIPFGANAHMHAGPITFKDDGQSPRKPPMKDDPDFRKHNQRAMDVTAAELRQFIERAEQLEAEKADIAQQSKELFAEAKGRGYSVKVMRKIIALRKRKPDDVAEEEAVLELYKQALGMS